MYRKCFIFSSFLSAWPFSKTKINDAYLLLFMSGYDIIQQPWIFWQHLWCLAVATVVYTLSLLITLHYTSDSKPVVFISSHQAEWLSNVVTSHPTVINCKLLGSLWLMNSWQRSFVSLPANNNNLYIIIMNEK